MFASAIEPIPYNLGYPEQLRVFTLPPITEVGGDPKESFTLDARFSLTFLPPCPLSVEAPLYELAIQDWSDWLRTPITGLQAVRILSAEY